MESRLGFKLDFWDYATAVVLFVCVVTGLTFVIWLAGLPGRKHPEAGSRYFCESFYGHPCPTNKDRLCEQREPRSYPVVGQARR